jgi:hypothetical protein
VALGARLRRPLSGRLLHGREAGRETHAKESDFEQEFNDVCAHVLLT